MNKIICAAWLPWVTTGVGEITVPLKDDEKADEKRSGRGVKEYGILNSLSI